MVEKERTTIEIPSVIMVRKLAELLNVPVAKVISKLLEYGVAATINESVDYDTAAIVADEFGFQTKALAPEGPQKTLGKKAQKNLKIRPPVVTVMGHVDHGKTKLLDTIRKANIIGTESGGITQHIGAYQVKIADKKTKKERLITFLDTPGHQAFSAMRAHGANITDIVVLVVAADEGIKPQTEEAVSHAKAAKVPIIVALNKIDKPEADIEKTKRGLSEAGLLPEEWGGQTIVVPISAKTGQNINLLLEMTLLLTDMLKIQADPKAKVVGVVIESHIHHGIGPLATVLIQNGTLCLKDVVVVGKTYGKIKMMENFLLQKIKEAPPSTPVRIGGLKDLPNFGEILFQVTCEKEAKEKISQMLKEQGAKKIIKAISAEKLPKEQIASQKKLNIILKADVQGSLEAIKQALKDLSSKEVQVEIISEGVGPLSETDVKMAAASSALILAFRVKVPAEVLKLANLEKVQISHYDIIYNLIDDIYQGLSQLLEPEIVKINLGKLKVLEIFRKTKMGGILGGKVTSGKVSKETQAEVLREENLVGEIKIISLQQNYRPVEKVEENFECGISYEGQIKIKIGDILQVYKIEKKIKKLEPVA